MPKDKNAAAPDLGWLEVCLTVEDIAKSKEFYQTLGFEVVGGVETQGWLVLELNGARIALYQGHIPNNLLNFRGGKVFEIADYLKAKGLKMESDAVHENDGSDGATIHDPDGNVIYFNTHPDEVEG